MSLRDTLKATVAGCTPHAMQPATFHGGNATGNATPVQQLPANPHGIRVSSATGTATVVQQTSCIGVEKAPSKVALVAPVARTSECNLQQGALTAQRLAKELIAAAMRAAAHWGDDPEEWRRQCAWVPLNQRSDLLEHLRTQYPEK